MLRYLASPVFAVHRRDISIGTQKSPISATRIPTTAKSTRAWEIRTIDGVSPFAHPTTDCQMPHNTNITSACGGSLSTPFGGHVISVRTRSRKV